MAENIFEQFKAKIDSLLAQFCGEVLEKVPAVYNRLAEGDSESVSQALTTCRRIIDSFADAVYPPRDSISGKDQEIKLGKQQVLNRIQQFVSERVTSASRQKRLTHTSRDLYDRICAGIHSDVVTSEEARCLFLLTYQFLGELILLKHYT